VRMDTEAAKYTIDGHVKLQFTKQQFGANTVSPPDWAAALHIRVPTSLNNPFDQPQIALSTAAEKQIFRWLTVMGAAAVSCHTYKPKIFKSDDVFTRMCAGDFAFGGVIDPGEEGGVYFPVIAKLEMARIGRKSDPLQPTFGPLATAGIRYNHKNLWDCGLSITETLQARPRSLTDDVTVLADCKVYELERFAERAKQGVKNIFKTQ
jgi:hypothetical protein